MDVSPLLLLVLVSALAVYDLRTQRVPNWVTLPLLAAGVLLGYPGPPEIWFGSLLLLAAWRLGMLGGGDAKLWLALLWLAQGSGPSVKGGAALLALGASLALSALAQLLWRTVRGGPLFGVPGPGAWRALTFVLWLLVAG